MDTIEIPGYEIYEQVGDGGMAKVYRARHINLDREVAIKVMDPGLNSDSTFAERFVREARISAKLLHPNIVQIYDVNSYRGINYIEMEYVGGGDLTELIDGPISRELLYKVMADITSALDYAAGIGYVHRDIKPGNILIRDDDEFVLADFGIARAADTGTQMTMTGTMIGTPSYMSPEQANGDEVDGRSDLYSLAVVCYRMLARELPFDAESAVTVAIKHLTEVVPTLSLPMTPFQSFIDKGLAKKPEERFQSGRELYTEFLTLHDQFPDQQELQDESQGDKTIVKVYPSFNSEGSPSNDASGSKRSVREASRTYRLVESPRSPEVRTLRAGQSDRLAGHVTAPISSRTKSVILVGTLLGCLILVAAGLYYFTEPFEDVPVIDQQTAVFKVLDNIPGILSGLEAQINDGEQTQFKIGEKLVFRFKSETDVYICIAHVDGAGVISLLWPDFGVSGNFLPAHVETLYPDQQSENDITVMPPLGKERFYVISTSRVFNSTVYTRSTNELLVNRSPSDFDHNVELAESFAEIVAGNEADRVAKVMLPMQVVD